MNYQEQIRKHLQESARVKEKTIAACSADIQRAIVTLSDAFKEGKKLLICGNGGSAADAQHIAAEFIVRLSPNLKRPAMPAVALTTDSSILTAAGNDIGFENIFARQVEALGQTNDVLLVISTSGNSVNMLQAVASAKENGMKVITLLGKGGGKLQQSGHINIIVPSDDTQHIQEAHIAIGHILCGNVEQSVFGKM